MFRFPVLAALLLTGLLTGLLPACGDDAPAPEATPATVSLEPVTPGVGSEAHTPSARTPPDSTGPLATAQTTGADDEGPPVVLRGDGIGAERFGAAVDTVLAGLTLRWGPPDTDSGWGPAATSPFGVCPGTRVRVVAWRGFRVYFSDGPTAHGPAGSPHLFTWEYLADDPGAPAPDPGGNRPPLRTEAGVSVGATVAALQKAYGGKLELFDEEPGGPSFGVSLSDGTLFGSLTTLEPTGVVRSITGGGGCGE